jgi:hypothetical protein
MKRTTITQLALILLIAGFTFTAKANSIVITEISNLVLTYSVNGGAAVTVNASTPDNWFFTTPNFQVVTTLGGTQDQSVNWQETSYATDGLVNMVRFFQYGPASNGSEITVTSDHLPTGAFEPGYPLVANGGTFTFPFADASTAQFTDSADASESVPEGGSAVALLGIAFAGIEGARRMLRPRKA